MSQTINQNTIFGELIRKLYDQLIERQFSNSEGCDCCARWSECPSCEEGEDYHGDDCCYVTLVRETAALLGVEPPKNIITQSDYELAFRKRQREETGCGDHSRSTQIDTHKAKS